MKKSASPAFPMPGKDRPNVLPLEGELDLHVSPTIVASLNMMIEKKPKQLVVGLTVARRTASDHNWMASRKPTRSFAKSTIDPCTPSSIISLNPFARVVITGKPQASASRQALENGS